MSYRHTLDAALESLHEIEDLVKGFPSDGNIPSVEIDLTLQKIRNIYELMLLMKKEEKTDMPATEIKAATETPAAASPAAATVSSVPPQTLGDQFKGRTTLHDSLHQAMGKEGETLAQAKPVTHLMTAIGINDRFTFIRELFSNDANSFENTMGILNDASSFNDAYNHMIQHFDWDMDSEPVQRLLEIIRRKFIKSRHE